MSFIGNFKEYTVNPFRRKKIKKECSDAIAQITSLYKELEKYSPGHIVFDRIKCEINRLRSIYNNRQLILLGDKVLFLIYGFVVISILLIASLFVKPKITIEITVTVAVVIILFITLPSLGILLARHFLTKKDREAKRKRDLAEATFLDSQTKNIEQKTNK